MHVYNIVGIVKTWLNILCNWSAAAEGYKVFMMDRQQRKRERAALNMRKQLKLLKLLGRH